MHVAETEINYKQKYKALKRKMKLLVYEQECFMEELRRAQRKLLKVSRDKTFLLDRLLQYERVQDDTSDSDATLGSDSDTEAQATPSKKRKQSPQGPLQDPTAILSGLGFPGFLPPHLMPQHQQAWPSGEQSKKKLTKTKKSISKKVPGMLKMSDKSSTSQLLTSQLSREEVERHLDSRPQMLGIERAPMSLPVDLFSNDNSNQESDKRLREQDIVVDVAE